MSAAPGSRPLAVVAGVDAGALSPGIDRVAELLRLAYAPDTDALRSALPGAQILLSWRTEPAELAEAWDAARDLRWIQTASAGVDALLFPGLIGSAVTVTNARGVYDEAIAEWVIGAMLAFVTGLHRSIVDQQRGVWTRGRETDRLAGRRLVVVGPGPIGRGTATRARALGMEIASVGRAPRQDDELGPIAGTRDLLPTIAGADFVLDALPLTASTAGVFGAEAFAAMGPDARFINVGRGATVDEPALVESLRSGVIAGAALDVFDVEPLPAGSPLWTMPNVIVSPHISGDAHGWEQGVLDLFTDNVRRWIAGEPLRNVVDKSAGHP